MRKKSLVVAVILTLLASLAAPAQAVPDDPAPTGRSNTLTKPVILVHGYDLWGGGWDCQSYWGDIKHRLTSNTHPEAASFVTTYGYYANDRNCWLRDSFTTATPIREIGMAFANKIYSNFSAHGVSVDLVGHSMGGLIIRAAMTGTANHEGGFPPYLLVEDVVTLSTPHRGASSSVLASVLGPLCPTQCQEMKYNSGTMDWLHDTPGVGTRWTVISFQDDIFIDPDTAMPDDMDADHKIWYQEDTYELVDDPHMQQLWNQEPNKRYLLRHCDARSSFCEMNRRYSFRFSDFSPAEAVKFSLYGWSERDPFMVWSSSNGMLCVCSPMQQSSGGAPGGPVPGRSSLDGNARADLLYVDATGKLTAFPNDNGTEGRWWSPRVVGDGWLPDNTFFANLDGDGKKDLVYVNTSGEIVAFPNVDGANYGWGQSRIIGSGWSAENIFFADLDGDGKDDLIYVSEGRVMALPNNNGIQGSWWSARQVGQGFTAENLFFADLNGDRKDEMIYIDAVGDIQAFQNSQGMSGQWYSAQNVGQGWRTDNTFFADLDGDGKDDLLYVSEGRLMLFPNDNGMLARWFSVRQVGQGWHPTNLIFA